MPYHHGDLATALLDAAEALARERGARAWSLREAATRTGVSPSAAYHHYADRQALVRALAGRHLDRLTAAMGTAVARTGNDADAAVAAIARTYVRWARRDPALFEVAFGSAREYRGVPVASDSFAVLTAAMGRIGLPLEDQGEASLAVWSSIHGLAALAATGPLQGRSERDVVDRAGRLAHVVLAGLRAGG